MFDDTFQKIDRDTIDAVCKEYNITPGDLFEYTKEEVFDDAAQVQSYPYLG